MFIRLNRRRRRCLKPGDRRRRRADVVLVFFLAFRGGARARTRSNERAYSPLCCLSLCASPPVCIVVAMHDSIPSSSKYGGGWARRIPPGGGSHMHSRGCPSFRAPSSPHRAASLLAHCIVFTQLRNQAKCHIIFDDALEEGDAPAPRLREHTTKLVRPPRCVRAASSRRFVAPPLQMHTWLCELCCLVLAMNLKIHTITTQMDQARETAARRAAAECRRRRA